MSKITSIISGLSLKEKADLVSGKDFWFTAQVPGLDRMMVSDGPSGLRKQADTSDALGLNKSVVAVNFPSSSLTANSFDCALLQELGRNLGQAAKAERVGILLGPGINLKRSPLAGRNFEYFSEDPYLIGELASSYVQGVQETGVGVSLKHFAANNRENQRFTASSNIDQRSLHELYLSAFEKVVKTAHPATIMCSYNAINGTLNSQNQRLLTQILREQWGFKGLVMSDWGAVSDHVAALKAGLDLEMPGKGAESTTEIVEAVNNGKLDEKILDRAVLRVIQMVEKWQPQSKTVVSYDLEKQHQFARQLADESIVLLKNEQQLLPLKPDQSLAVIGQLAEKPRYQGSGSAHVNAYKAISPLKTVRKALPKTAYQAGYQIDSGQIDRQSEQAAVDLAKQVDQIVVFAGFPSSYESEGFDKQTISLPDNQNHLIERLAAVNKKIIVVLENGSALEMPWVGKVGAIVETYLAGEAVGQSTWDVLFGHVNPSGKLAESFPIKLSDNPTYLAFNADQNEENYHEGLFAGYRYYDKKKQEVLFPFGYGLSYTTFDYRKLELLKSDRQVTVSFEIKNTGSVAGKEIAQLYLSNQTSKIEKPPKELKGFVKVSLNPGQTKQAKITLDKRSFSWYNPKTEKWQVDNGSYQVQLAASSRDIRLTKNLVIDWSENKRQAISSDSYLSDILREPTFKVALQKSGLDELLKQLAGDENNQAILTNMPLRALMMMGVSNHQIQQFVNLANQS
ncbi:glycosyl hydrolase [Oenococcus sp. UCMA 16435]|nr:glycosyl hydrolase [Oenococcus sp. UCMA 16435]